MMTRALKAAAPDGSRTAPESVAARNGNQQTLQEASRNTRGILRVVTAVTGAGSMAEGREDRNCGTGVDIEDP